MLCHPVVAIFEDQAREIADSLGQAASLYLLRRGLWLWWYWSRRSGQGYWAADGWAGVVGVDGAARFVADPIAPLLAV